MDRRTPDSRDHAETRDLGRVDAPVLVCGGAYSNIEAVTALLEAADELAIPSGRIIHTGDVVAYCADPAETATLLRKSKMHAIQGNVEQSLSARLRDCGCGFDENSHCERLAAEWFAFADARIDDDLRRWMGRLPHHLTFEMSGRRIRVVHGGVREINRFIFASQPDADFAAEFAAANAVMILAGHSGIPFTRSIGARVWHNSGALGLPANDGTPRAWFSVLTPEDDGIRIDHHALDYDHASARAKMVEAGLSSAYEEALETGLWPSLDVLPQAERRMTGTPLDLRAPFFWAAAAAIAG